MTPGAGVLVLGRGHISHIVKMHYSFKNLFLYSKAQIRQTKYIVMMTSEGSTKIVNFMTQRAGILVRECDHKSYIVKMPYFFKNLLFTQAQIRQTESIVLIINEESTKIITFIYLPPGAGVLVLGRGIVNMQYFFTSFYGYFMLGRSFIGNYNSEYACIYAYVYSNMERRNFLMWSTRL